MAGNSIDLDLTPAAFLAAWDGYFGDKENAKTIYDGLLPSAHPTRHLAQSQNLLESLALATRDRMAGGLISVLEHGAVGDGSTNDAAAIQNAIDAAAAAGTGVLLPFRTFAIADGLVNTECVPFVCFGELLFTGSGESAFRFGRVGSTVLTPSPLPSIVKVRRTSRDFADANAGIHLLSVGQLHVTVYAEDFETGVLMEGDGGGTSYNQIRVQWIYNCRASFRHRAVNSGWSNENVIIGGRISTQSTLSSALNVHGVEFVCDSASIPNGNKYIGCSFELRNVGAGFTSVCHGEFSTGSVAAQHNSFEHMRYEYNNYLISGEGIQRNSFDIDYIGPDDTVAADFLNPATADDFVTLVQNRITSRQPYLGHSEPIRIARCGRGGVRLAAFAVTRPARGAVWDRSAGNFIESIGGTSGLSDENITLGFSDVWGFLVDLRSSARDFQRLLTTKADVVSTGGRVAVVCWDASFVELTAAEHCNLVYHANGYYRQQSDMTALNGEQLLAFGPDVAYAFVGITDAGTDAVIRSFEIFKIGLADIHLVEAGSILDSLSNTPPGITLLQQDTAIP